MKIINKIYNIDNTLNKSIVLISDIHYSNKKDIKRLNCVLDNIKKIKPNYICIPGDITNQSNIKDEDLFISWLRKLSSVSKVIISIGNHEYYIDKKRKIYGLNKLLLNRISNIKNLYLLDNKNIIIDNINFIGITLPIELYDKETKKTKEFNLYLDKIRTYKKYYNILLCHSPINIVNSKILNKKNINLILCGHMHGGAVPSFMRRLFKNKGFITPELELLPKNVYGYLKIGNTDIVITSGLRVTPFKLLNKLFYLEIVKINLTF